MVIFSLIVVIKFKKIENCSSDFFFIMYLQEFSTQPFKPYSKYSNSYFKGERLKVAAALFVYVHTYI